MGQPEVSAAAVNASSTTKAVVDNARRLGLTWNRRIATVIDPTVPTAIFDGDQVPLRMTSMLGIALVAGNRVYVDLLPPSGLFIVGRVGVSTANYHQYHVSTATESSVIFSDIPAAAASVELRWRARIDAAVNLQFIGARLNSNAGAVYSWHYTQGLNATASAAPFTGQTYAMIGFCVGSLASADVYGSGAAFFIGWDQTVNPTFNHFSEALGTGVANFASTNGGGVMAATDTWTSLEILPASGSFVAGSTFEIHAEVV